LTSSPSWLNWGKRRKQMVRHEKKTGYVLSAWDRISIYIDKNIRPLLRNAAMEDCIPAVELVYNFICDS